MTHIRKSQEYSLTNPSFVLSINTPLEKSVAEFSPKERLVLNFLLKLSNKYRYLYPSIKCMANICDASERTVYRVIAKLESLGLISHYRRLKYMTNLYRIADIFWNPVIRAKLSSLLPALKWMPIVMLAGINMALFGRYGSGYKAYAGNGSGSNYVTQSFNILKSYSSLDSLFINRPALRSKGDTGRHNRLDKKGAGVEQFVQKRHGISLICPTLREIPWLTDYGKAKLSCFPEEAIKQALDRLADNKPNSVKDPYRLFFYFAMEYCNQKNIRADYAYSASLEKDYDKTGQLMIMDLFLSAGKSTKEKEPIRGKSAGFTGKPKIAREERIAQLKHEIASFTEQVTNPPVHLSSIPFGDTLIELAKTSLSIAIFELQELENNHE